jgi:small subunit ribosomal protein S1
MSENNIINLPADEAGPNADAQESANVEQNTEATAATTNVPVEEAENTPAAESTPEPVIESSVAESIPQPVEERLAAHDDFDWSIDKRNVTQYKQEEKEKYDKVYENTFVSIEDGEIVNGSLVALTKTDAGD